MTVKKWAKLCRVIVNVLLEEQAPWTLERGSVSVKKCFVQRLSFTEWVERRSGNCWFQELSTMDDKIFQVHSCKVASLVEKQNAVMGDGISFHVRLELTPFGFWPQEKRYKMVNASFLSKTRKYCTNCTNNCAVYRYKVESLVQGKSMRKNCAVYYLSIYRSDMTIHMINCAVKLIVC